MSVGNNFRKAIIPLCFVLIIDAMSWGIVIPCLGPIIIELKTGMLPADTSLATRNMLFSMALGLPMLFMFFGAPLLGDISDRIGRKKALLIALLGISFSCLLSALGVIVGSILLLMIGRCIIGFMDSSEAIAKAAIADISTDKHKIVNMSLMSLCGTLGFVGAPILGGILSNEAISPYFTYVTPFLVAAVLAFINALVLWVLFQETFIAKSQPKFHLLSSFRNLISAFVDKRIRNLSIIFFCMQFAWGGYFQIISILLIEDYHYNTQEVGIFITYLALCFAFIWSFFIRILVKHFSAVSIVRMGMFLVIWGMAFIAFTKDIKWVWISVLPATFGVGFCYTTVLSLFSDAVEKENQGRVMGVATALFAISWVVSSFICGYFSTHHIRLPFIFLFIVSIVGWLCAFQKPVKRTS